MDRDELAAYVAELRELEEVQMLLYEKGIDLDREIGRLDLGEIARRREVIKRHPKEGSQAYWEDALEGGLYRMARDELMRMRARMGRLLPGGSTDTERIEKARKYPLEELLGGISWRGNRGWRRCPFHSERSGSFCIYRDDNHYHCYGCGAHGDSISLVMELEGLSFKSALDRLAA